MPPGDSPVSHSYSLSRPHRPPLPLHVVPVGIVIFGNYQVPEHHGQLGAFSLPTAQPIVKQAR